MLAEQDAVVIDELGQVAHAAAEAAGLSHGARQARGAKVRVHERAHQLLPRQAVRTDLRALAPVAQSRREIEAPVSRGRKNAAQLTLAQLRACAPCCRRACALPRPMDGRR